MTLLEKGEQAKAEFEQGKAFFVAAYLIAPFFDKLQALVRKPLKARRVFVGEIPILAYLLPKKTINGLCMKDVFYAELALFNGIPDAVTSIFQAMFKGTTFPIVCGMEAQVTLDIEDKKSVANYTASEIQVLERLYKQVTIFSYITGMRVCLYTDPRYETRMPMPMDSGTLHIFIRSAPPGEHGPVEYCSHLFDRQLHKEGKCIPVLSSTKGRGMVLSTMSESKAVPYAQIIENNVYILIPFLHHYWEPTMSDVLFRVLGNAYQAILDGVQDIEDQARQTESCTEHDFMSTIADPMVFRASYWEQCIEVERRKIKEHQDALRSAYLMLREWTSRKESCTDLAYYIDAIKRISGDRQRIQTMPEVQQLVVIDGGIHVYTKPIVAEWEGKQYALGSYAIRAASTGIVSVWAVETTHPHGVPHPHIAKNGFACFGSVTDAIMKASADFRMYDAIQYVITWLTHGYTPELAEYKIEEWICLNPEGES